MAYLLGGNTFYGNQDYTNAALFVATPTSGSNPVTKTYADAITAYAQSLSMSSALPVMTGNAGMEITNNGVLAKWGLNGPGALAILNFIGY